MKQLGIGSGLMVTAALLFWSAGAFAQTTGGNMNGHMMKNHTAKSHMMNGHMMNGHMTKSHMSKSYTMKRHTMNGHMTKGHMANMSAGHTTWVKGKVSGLDLKSKTFAVVSGKSHISVNARNARIMFRNKPANLARLEGSPTVRVTGVRVAGRLPLIRATRVTVLSGSTTRLQPSHYTRMARPTHPAVASRGRMTHSKMHSRMTKM
ncbi:MAG TPA: hypothetical protein VFJ58_12400 [Armatimonadota bacterium]|nr:hypothetical protein [Armatimonadota bacterium]